jgi:hypothetical protein
VERPLVRGACVADLKEHVAKQTDALNETDALNAERTRL